MFSDISSLVWPPIVSESAVSGRDVGVSASISQNSVCKQTKGRVDNDCVLSEQTEFGRDLVGVSLEEVSADCQPIVFTTSVHQRSVIGDEQPATHRFTAALQ